MKLLIVAAAALSFGTAQASTLKFEAFSAEYSYSGFTILFDDTNSDSLLAFDEILSLSGFTCSYSGCANQPYDTVTDIPLIAGFTSDTGPNPDQTWQFNIGGNPLTGIYPLYASSFTYAISQVPVPPAALFLLSGVGAASLLGRRKAKAPSTQS